VKFRTACRVLLAVTSLAATGHAAAIEAMFAGPVEVREGSVASRDALAAPSIAAHRIPLTAPSVDELASVPAQNAAGMGKAQPLAIGIGRALPQGSRTVALDGLAWTMIAGGTRVAHIEVASPGAAALRVAVQASAAVDGLSMRFAGTDGDVLGAVAMRDVKATTAQRGQYWSPVLAGDVATIELTAAPGAAIDGISLRIPRLSHLLVDGAQLLSPQAPIARATGVGAAGACETDVACVAPINAAAADLAKSVAKVSFVGEDGRSYLCSGTLIADTTHSNTPYLLSANHCLKSDAIAQTLNTYWFYAAAACNSGTAAQFVHLRGGARLLGRSQDSDWSIVRLNETPPAGTMFAAWRAEAIATGTAVVTIHHPEGDLAKFSQGQVTGTLAIADDYVDGTFTQVVWSQGVTEPGSSGSLVATLAAAGSHYEVRGALYAGASACSSPHAPDYFSRLETALPVMRQYLTPGAANPNGEVVAVEFYNASLDHYFLSTDPVEIGNLDSGHTVGWARTGLRFLVYDHQAPNTSPVCRFYRTPGYGDSHFYSASPQECAQTAAAHPVDWIYESASVFYAQLPDTARGACPGGTVAVYRFFNASTTNHRYTVEMFLRDQMEASPLWTPEGYGPGPYYPVMCAALQ
jgi:hypothetical protein